MSIDTLDRFLSKWGVLASLFVTYTLALVWLISLDNDVDGLKKEVLSMKEDSAEIAQKVNDIHDYVTAQNAIAKHNENPHNKTN